MVAGQLQADIVLGQQDVGGLGEDCRFVVGQPEQLGRCQAGHGGDARYVAEGRDGGLEGFALGGGAAVVPQDRGAQGAVVGVEQDGAVHLAGQADRGGSREGLRVRFGGAWRRLDWWRSTRGRGAVRTTADGDGSW